MAINYEPVGWDTTKHFNPTNMNHMDGGIKAACDKVDEHDSEIAEINSNFILVKNHSLAHTHLLIQLKQNYKYLTHQLQN